MLNTLGTLSPRRPRAAATMLVATFALVQLAAGTTFAAADDDAAILPYLDEGTFFVLRLDLDRVDHAATEKFMMDVMMSRAQSAQIPEDIKKEMQERGKKDIAETKTWLTDMVAAGGKRLYVLIDQADQEGPGGGPVMVVPVADGANAQKISDVLSRNNGGGRQTAAEVGKGVVMASERALGRVKKLVEGSTTAQRSDLAPALAAAAKRAPDGPMRIAFIPGESTRTWIEENLPMLPPQLGGGETKILSRGVRYVAAGVTQKPNVLADVTVHAEDAAQAKALMDVLSKGTAFVKEISAGSPQEEETNKQLDVMKPKLAGDTITLAIDPVMAQSAMMGIAMRTAGPAPAIVPARPGQPAQPKQDDGGL